MTAATALPTRAANWRARAICVRHTDPDALFSDAPTQRREAVACRRCPVITECLGWALDTRFPFGVLGGMTERQRRDLLRRRPNVSSWGRLIEAAREQWQATHQADVSAGVR